jgi:hypothetical protein
VSLENVSLRFYLGDTWSSPQWAVLVDDLPVNLAADGWVVRCQVRRTPDRPVLHEWSTTAGSIQLSTANVVFGDTGESGATSTIQLLNDADETDEWKPFSAEFEIEIERGSGNNVERHTVITGHMTAMEDVADT